MGPIIGSPASRLVMLTGLVAGTFSLSAPVFAQDDSTMSPVHYSSEQADRGEDRFERDCVDCHGDDLRGGLIGGFMSLLMPPNAPGRYSPEVYADLMAYILQENGFPAGDPLPSDMESLNKLIVQK